MLDVNLTMTQSYKFVLFGEIHGAEGTSNSKVHAELNETTNATIQQNQGSGDEKLSKQHRC